MSELDDKLREILILEVYFKDESTGGKELAAQTAIRQIKQVFLEAKWIPGDQAGMAMALGNYMTGAEWYQRYRYLCMSSGYYSDDLPMMKLARRAAGLEEETK